MSVMITIQVTGDSKALEQFASSNAEKMQDILAAAKRHGLIAHRFYGSDDGAALMVADEWPDRQSFESFFHEKAPDIMLIFEAAGITARPEPMVWHSLETADAYGWGA